MAALIIHPQLRISTVDTFAIATTTISWKVVLTVDCIFMRIYKPYSNDNPLYSNESSTSKITFRDRRCQKRLIEVIWSLVKESNKSVLCNPTISSTSNFVLQPNSLLQETSPNKVKHKPALLAIVVCSQLQQLKAIAVQKLLCCRIHTIQ